MQKDVIQNVTASMNRRKVRPAGQRNAALRKWSAKKQATDLNWRLTKQSSDTTLVGTQEESEIGAVRLHLLGCSIENFKIYLESLFEVGMSWENYGNKEGQWNSRSYSCHVLFSI